MQLVINDLLIHYQILGPKNKPTILLLHGWGHNLEMWRNVANLLANNHRVILLDLPGFGQSSLPLQTFDLSRYTQVSEDFIARLKLDNLILIGHSIGGKIAINYSAQNPQTIRQLILISPSGIESKTLKARLAIFITKTIKPLSSLLPTSSQKWLFNHLASPDYRQAGPLKATFKQIVSQNVINQANQIKLPTLILWGEKDQEVPLKYAKKLRRLISGSTLRLLWGLGHSPHLEAPQKLASLIQEYL